MASDVQIAGGVGAAPQSYTVPNATEIIPKAVTALFDGTGAAGAFVPTIEIVSDGGVVVARVPTTTVVAAGGSAEVTWAPFLRGITSGTPAGFIATLLLTYPDALWKLDEAAGTTAADSLAGHHDMSAVGTTPTWGQDVAPPGDTSAEFPFRGGFTSTASGYTPNLSGDFTAGVWVERVSAGTQTLMGQGQPITTPGGWELTMEGGADIFPNRFGLWVNGGAAGNIVPSDFTIGLGAWYWLVVTNSGGTFTLYINGSAQSTVYAGAYAAAAGSPIWLGWDNIELFSIGHFRLAYATVWATRALSASEIAGIYLAA